MMKQYFQIKEQYPNTLLFFRLGDFYEMFFNDAKTAAKELELTLTGRDCGQDERAPMCGVPYHSAETYIARLVAKGYKVAICEQTEDPAAAKGIVKREVIRVITPGTVLESSMLDETKNNFICSLFYSENGVGLAFADVSTGELHATRCVNSSDTQSFILNELSRFMPKEILLNPDALSLKSLESFIREKLEASVECLSDGQYNLESAQELLTERFNTSYLNNSGVFEYPAILCALGALFSYLKETQKSETDRIREIDVYANSGVMGLDINARRNLELTETLRSKEKRGSLLWVLDRTCTAMGKRLIRTWIEQPLLSPAKITLRQNATEELFENRILSDEISETLKGIYDLERIMSRIVYGSAGGREIRSLWFALTKLPNLKKLLEGCKSTQLKEIFGEIDLLTDVSELIDRSIVDEPPFSVREGGIIREGYSEELDEIRFDMNGGKGLIAEIEQKEKERTGIPKLKVGYNRVFGYYIEITNSYKAQVPPEYIRKQTLSNCERYITDELKVLESRILTAHDRSVAIESMLFEEVRKSIALELDRVQSTARAIGELDVLNSFGVVAAKNNYTRPTVNTSGKIFIKDGRHPVVEVLLNGNPFVPNDSDMDMNDNRISVITGPNMAGKSTFMRQTAIIVVMAQIGSFVPATSAEIGIVDKIYTRVGASDDLSTGQSTFMIEMTEVADILKNATKQSLIVLDEIGRGTSTYDGMSIARAVLEFIHDKKGIGAKTLFATHYHELTDLEDALPGVKNFNIAVRKKGDDITFLRRIVRGGCDDSFGIQVAKLAGVPDKVVSRAKQVLIGLEQQDGKSPAVDFQEELPLQITMDTADSAVLSRLRKIDVNELTPMQCMNALFELVGMLK